MTEQTPQSAPTIADEVNPTASMAASQQEPPVSENGDERGTQRERPSGTAENATTGPCRNGVFEALKNPRRRTLLRRLDSSDGPMALGDLAEHVAAVENDKPVAAVTSKERKRVYVSLYQCHLPKLDSMQLVEFNKDRGRVAIGSCASHLDPYLYPTESSSSLTVHGVGIVAAGAVVFSGGAIAGLITPITAAAVLFGVALGTASLLACRRYEQQTDN